MSTEEISANSKGSFQSKFPALPLPSFDGSDLENFLKSWERWLRLSGVEFSDDKTKLDWLIESCTPKVKKLVERLVEEIPDDLVKVLQKMETLFPKLENDMTLRISLERIPSFLNPQIPQVWPNFWLSYKKFLCASALVQCQTK